MTKKLLFRLLKGLDKTLRPTRLAWSRVAGRDLLLHLLGAWLLLALLLGTLRLSILVIVLIRLLISEISGCSISKHAI